MGFTKTYFYKNDFSIKKKFFAINNLTNSWASVSMLSDTHLSLHRIFILRQNCKRVVPQPIHLKKGFI